jgi:hypothetical protein
MYGWLGGERWREERREIDKQEPKKQLKWQSILGFIPSTRERKRQMDERRELQIQSFSSNTSHILISTKQVPLKKLLMIKRWNCCLS